MSVNLFFKVFIMDSGARVLLLGDPPVSEQQQCLIADVPRDWAVTSPLEAMSQLPSHDGSQSTKRLLICTFQGWCRCHYDVRLGHAASLQKQ